MTNIVMFVISIPKLSLDIDEYIPIIRPVKNTGYTIASGGVGTVTVNITATLRFNIQAIVSSTSLFGFECQSS